jgi:hypothetical protein
MGYSISATRDTGRNLKLVPTGIGHLPRERWPHVRVRLPVGVVLGGKENGALAKDFGPEGAFIESIDAPERGNRVEIVVRYPLVERELRLSAVVGWVTSSGFGVQFVRLDEGEQRAVAALAEAFW